jgi:hypothetical protein
VWRKIGIVAAGVVLVLLTVLTAVVVTLPAERIGKLVAARASQALDRDVEIVSARPRVLPRPAISLGGVLLSEAGHSAHDQPMASAERIDMRFRLRPLLRRQIVLDQLVLHRPVVSISVDEAGEWNVPGLGQNDEVGDDGFTFDLRRLSVMGGTLVVQGGRDGTSVRLADLNQAVHVAAGSRRGAGPLTLEGDARALLDLDLPGRLADRPRAVPIQLTHRLDVHRDGTVQLESVRLRLAGLEARARGSLIAAAGDRPAEFDLMLETDRLDSGHLVGTLTAMLPEALTPLTGPDAPRFRGPLRASGSLRGAYGPEQRPDFAATVVLEGTSVEPSQAALTLRDVRGQVHFRDGRLQGRQISGRLLEEAMQASFDVSNLGDPKGTLTLRSGIDWRSATRAGLLPRDWQGSGRAGFEITATGALLDPASIDLQGSVALRNVELRLPSAPNPVRVAAADIGVRGQEIFSTDVAVRVGGSGASVDFRLGEWLQRLLGGEGDLPRLTLDVRSDRIVLEDVLELEPARYGYAELFLAQLRGDRIDGSEARQHAAEADLRLPEIEALRVVGRVDVGIWEQAGTILHDVSAEFAAAGGTMELRSGRFRLEGEGVRLSGALGAGGGVDRRPIPLALEFTFFDTGQDEFFGRFSSLNGHVRGSAAFGGTASLLLDEHLLPVAETMVGAGTIRLTGGQFRNWPITRLVGEALGLPGFDLLEIHSGEGAFRLEGRSVQLDGWQFQAGQLHAEAGGLFTLQGALDLSLRLDLPPSVANLARSTPAAVVLTAASGPGGAVPIGFGIGGTATAPTASLDLSAARQLAADFTRRKAADAAAEAARKAALEALRRTTSASGAGKPSGLPREQDQPMEGADTLLTRRNGTDAD